jgi:hypothetical protein
MNVKNLMFTDMLYAEEYQMSVSQHRTQYKTQDSITTFFFYLKQRIL